MHLAFAGILIWLCPQEMKRVKHFFFSYIDHICRWTAPFIANLLYQPVNSLPLLTAFLFKKIKIDFPFNDWIEVVYLTKRELLINYLHEHSTSADSTVYTWRFFVVYEQKITRLWSVWYLELANVVRRMRSMFKISRITLWNVTVIVPALMCWACQVASVTSFCCCSFLTFYREPLTVEAT